MNGNGEKGVNGTLRLECMDAGRPARIVSMSFSEPRRLVKLSNLGLVPGATVRLLHRRPATVVSCGGTVIALDPGISAEIHVEPLD